MSQSPKNYQFTVVYEISDEGVVAACAQLPGCHAFGDTRDSAKAALLEVIALHLETYDKLNEPVPYEDQSVEVEHIEIPA